MCSKVWLSSITLVMLGVMVALLSACGGGSDDGGNIGWVKITEPSTLDTYTVSDITEINLAGETFISPVGEMKDGLFCTCTIWQCGFYIDSYCEKRPYYDSGITLTVTNQATNFSVKVRLTSNIDSDSLWNGPVPLARSENVIQVRAEDDLGNWGTDQITINVEDTIPPTVLSTSPQNTAIVSVSTAITVTFSEAMDTSTITTTSFTLNDGVSNISGVISFSSNDTMATFTPSTNLDYNRTYTVTLNNTIKDTTGLSLTTTFWNFNTDLLPSPLNVQAVGSDGEITLSWDALPEADYYNIYYDISPDVSITSGTKISGITSTSYSHSSLANGETYYYVVTMVNNNEESLPSTIASAMSGLVITKLTSSGTSDSGYGIAVDAVDNSYITGSTTGDLAGTGNNGSGDIFLAKYDASGNPHWIRQFGSTFYDEALGIAVDSNGNIYITGYINGNDADIFIAKYDASGNQLWIRQFGTIASDVGISIAVDTSGNSYITGYTTGDIAGTGNNGDKDVFIAKYDASGNSIWIKQFGTQTYDSGSGITVDTSGNIYITGVNSYGDIFVASYDTSGNQQWMNQIDTTYVNRSSGIALDANGNSYITGYTAGDLAGTGNNGNFDAFIAKHDVSGNLLWIRQFGSTERDEAKSIALDSNGNSYITGNTGGDLAGTGNNGDKDVFIAKYDASGNSIWIKQFGTANTDVGNDIAVDAGSHTYITGFTTWYDVFLAHLYP
jgi:hypothetical protein